MAAEVRARRSPARCWRVPLAPAAPGRLGLLVFLAGPVGGFLAPDAALRRRARRRARAAASSSCPTSPTCCASRSTPACRRRARSPRSGGATPACSPPSSRAVAHRHRARRPARRGARHRSSPARRSRASPRSPPRCAAPRRHGAPLGPALDAIAADARAERARAPAGPGRPRGAADPARRRAAARPRRPAARGGGARSSAPLTLLHADDELAALDVALALAAGHDGGELLERLPGPLALRPGLLQRAGVVEQPAHGLEVEEELRLDAVAELARRVLVRRVVGERAPSRLDARPRARRCRRR